jgi:hypothetical protein
MIRIFCCRLQVIAALLLQVIAALWLQVGAALWLQVIAALLLLALRRPSGVEGCALVAGYRCAFVAGYRCARVAGTAETERSRGLRSGCRLSLRSCCWHCGDRAESRAALLLGVLVEFRPFN